MDYRERLRRLAISDLRLAEDRIGGTEVESSDLCPKSLALVRLAALIAVDGATPSYLAHAESAMSAGASCAEIVDVLLAVIPIVGFPRVVAAAPKLALAIGYDIDAAFFDHFDW
jgi:alkylhydroperoxidase/carboxymuconolactone decarboxylase family protein YurZ